MKITIYQVRARAEELRRALDSAFTRETAFSASRNDVPSAGHCAVVAVIVRRWLGGRLVSAMVANQSHWFNRLQAGKRFVDMDLTGDQFGRPPVQIRTAGQLYTGTRVRRPVELKAETIQRSEILEERARLFALSSPEPSREERPLVLRGSLTQRKCPKGAAAARKKM